jgi:protein tyrosine/serine phosphatase
MNELPYNFSFVDDNIAGSGQPQTKNHLESLLKQDISVIISLTPTSTKSLLNLSGMERDFELYHYPTASFPHISQLQDFFETIQAKLAENKKILVHCQFGQERTGIFLSWYLKQKYQISSQESMDKLWKLRPNSLKSYNSVQYFLSL